MAQPATQGSSYVQRPDSSSLADVIELILDKGLVIDAYVNVSVVGIALLTIDARIVIASVDTYLRFAEAASRLNLAEDSGDGIGSLTGSLTKQTAQGAVEGGRDGLANAARDTVAGVAGTAKQAIVGDQDDDESEDDS